jgi:hypothetical protein
MSIDWNLVGLLAGPVVGAVIGAWWTRKLERRPQLVSYFGHVSGFRYHPPGGGAPFNINSHTVILRNAGSQSATNIRLHHADTVPAFSIWPQVPHTVDTLPDGSQDIVIPVLVPNQEITIGYMYAPPLVVAQINAGIRCDQGFATPIPVLLQRQFPKWWNLTAFIFFLIGVVAVAYVIYLALRGAL